jgi:transposase
MVSMDQYLQIRLAHRDGMGINQLAQTFHHSKRKICQILAEAGPNVYPPRRPGPSILDPFKPVIDAIVKADETAPPKQRHTSAKIYRRLRDEHNYTGGPERVRLYLCGQRQRHVETFIPLDHDPGQRLEADFGHIYVDFPDGRRQVAVLLTTWGYSNCPFAIAVPTERTEAVLHGLVEAFAFYAAVPRELWWDNPKTVAPFIFKGRERGLQERYAALASHYRFEPLFCLVRQPQEKPRVEGRVQFCQQDWATPVPRAADLAELNAYLKGCALRDRQRTQANQTETIAERFERDRAKALPLPQRPFDACVLEPAQVDKYQTARFDRNRYSVPRLWAFRPVTVKGYVAEVAVVAEGQVVARHPRCYGRGEMILDPLHYLAELGRKPAALDHANVFRHWALPAIFGELRQALEQEQGSHSGGRQFIRVLQLLGWHTLERVQRAVEMSRTSSGFDVAAILRRTPCATESTLEAPTGAPESPVVVEAGAVQVPAPNLRLFDQLLTMETNDARSAYSVVDQDQPEATALAGDASGV